MKPIGVILALLLLLALPGAASAQEPYKIGAVFSITGPGSSLGIPERDTAQMLEAEVNAKGGLPGPDGKRHPVKVVIYDDASALDQQPSYEEVRRIYLGESRCVRQET